MPPARLPTRGVPCPLPPVVERRDDVQHDRDEVRRLAPVEVRGVGDVDEPRRREFGPRLVAVAASADSRDVEARAERESSQIAVGKSQQVALIDLGGRL